LIEGIKRENEYDQMQNEDNDAGGPAHDSPDFHQWRFSLTSHIRFAHSEFFKTRSATKGLPLETANL